MHRPSINYKIMLFLCIAVFVALYIFCANNLLNENPAGGNFYTWKMNYSSLLWIPLMFIYLYIALSDLRKKDFLNYNIVFTILMYGFPLIAYSTCIETSLMQIVYVNVFLIVLLFLQRFEFSLGGRHIIKSFDKTTGLYDKNTYQKKFFVIMIIIFITIGIYIYINGFSFSMSLTGVYASRSLYKEKANFIITSIKEAFSWFIVPILIMRGLNRRKYPFAIVMIIMELLLFALAKDKIVLLLLFLAIAFHFVKRYDAVRIALLVVIASVGMLLLSVVLYSISGSTVFYELLPRRLFVTPSNVADYYYRFFEINEKLIWRQDVFLIDKFFPDVYDTSYTQLIVSNYLYDLDTNPCTGVIAESFVHFGIFGAVIYGILLKIVTKIIENAAKTINRKELVFVFISFSYMLIDAAMTSTSFVLDVIILLFFIKLIPDYNKEEMQ